MDLRQLAINAASAARARNRQRQAGFTIGGHRLWTEHERRVIAKHKPNYDRLCQLLPHRTRGAIIKEALSLGPKRFVRRWTAAEVSKLRKLYPSAPAEEICAAFPWACWINIRQLARYHGFRRKQKAYKITGIPALDDVRRRCFEIGWSMRDLDSAARTGRYFYCGGWSGKRINYRALGRAIEALDGQFRVQWNDAA
jgi:hypothetical protein